MSTFRKMIGSGSLLAAFVLPLCLAIPVPCAAASAADLAARANPPLLASDGVDLPEIFIPKPPPPAPPPARAGHLLLASDGVDLPEIFIPKPPPPAPPPARA